MRKQELADQQLQMVARTIPEARLALGICTGRGSRAWALNPSVTDFLPLTHMVHLPHARQQRFGCTPERVITMFTDIVTDRQEQGVQDMFLRSKRAHEQRPGQTWTHVCHDHLFDGVALRFRSRRRRAGYRQCAASVREEVFVQRGFTVVASKLLGKEPRQDPVLVGTPWFVPPYIVTTTSAAAISPAIILGEPKGFQMFFDPDELKAKSESVSSLTLCKTCDRGSGNLLWLKFLQAEFFERIFPRFPNICLWSDCCAAHSHHRGKLGLRDLRQHTLAVHSEAKVGKLQTTQDMLIGNIERLTVLHMKRRVEPPPDPSTVPARLATGLDILLEPEKRHHLRKNGAKSIHITDAILLGSFFQGSLDEGLVHYCSGKDCCEDLAATQAHGTMLLVNVLCGKSDVIPAESTWTHVSAALKHNVVRRLPCRIGLEAWGKPSPQAEQPHAMQLDGNALTAQAKSEDGIRLLAARTYLNDMDKQNEALLLSLACNEFDKHLLWPILGDSIKEGASVSPKLPKLLDREESKIGCCTAAWAHFLSSYGVGGPERRPWGILRVLGIDDRSQQFMLQARSIVLRISSQTFRRFEVHFTDRLFQLYTLLSDDAPDDEKAGICADIRAAPHGELDVYVVCFIRLYNTVIAMLSERALSQIFVDFSSKCVSTDLVERLNSEMVRVNKVRAPGLQFLRSQRKAVVQQVSAAHRARGGNDPARSIGHWTPGLTEVVVTHPLLLDCERPAGHGANEGLPFGDVASDQQAPADIAGGDVHDLAILPQQPLNVALRSTEATNGAWGRAVCLAHGGLDGVVRASRPQPSYLDPDNAVLVASEPVRKRRGLNPYVMERNRQLKAMKLAKGSPLTDMEIHAMEAAVKRKFALMNEEESEVFRTLHKEWQMEAPTKEEKPPPEYHPMWGGGNSQTPVSAEEMHSRWQKHGWPDWEHVRKGRGIDNTVPADTTVDYNKYERVVLGGCGRWPRNVPKRHFHNLPQHLFVEQGIHNFAVTQRAIADQAHLMLAVEGPALDNGGKTHARHTFILTGVTYSPCVFEVAMQDFVDPANGRREEIAMPAETTIRDRPCRVTPEFTAIDHMTSDELILLIEKTIATPVLIRYMYEVVYDGTLRRSLITGVDKIGTLWRPGMAKPLFHEVRTRPKKEASMVDNDPLDVAALKDAPREPRRGRGGGRGRAGACNRGRGIAGGRGDVHVDPSNGGLPPHAPIPVEELGEPEPEHDLADYPVFGPGGGDAAGDWAFFWTSDEDDDAPAAPGSPEGGGCGTGDPSPTIDVVEAHVEAAVAATGVQEDEPLDAEEEEEAAAPSPEHGVAEEPAPPPWADLAEPSAMGYCYQAGRSVCRIQRRSDGRLWLNCYRHTGCRVNVGIDESGGPSDQEIFVWLYTGEATTTATPLPERKRLAKQHMDRAKELWGRRR